MRIVNARMDFPPNDLPAWTVGDRLRKAREHAGHSREELAHLLDITRQTVLNAESGKHRPHKATMRAWAQVTGVPLHWLLTGEERRQREQPTPLERRRLRRGNVQHRAARAM